MTVGEKIKDARKRAGLSQEELASRIGFSRVNIGQFETNKRNPKHETLLKIANALNISVYELLPDIITVATPDGGVYVGSYDDPHFYKYTKIKLFCDYLTITGINFSNGVMTFDGERYSITPDQLDIIMNSTEEHIKTLIRAIGKKVEE